MLQTVDAIGINIPAVFFFCVTVMGSIILYNYFTAIFVLSYMEILGRSDVGRGRQTQGDMHRDTQREIHTETRTDTHTACIETAFEI